MKVRRPASSHLVRQYRLHAPSKSNPGELREVGSLLVVKNGRQPQRSFVSQPKRIQSRQSRSSTIINRKISYRSQASPAKSHVYATNDKVSPMQFAKPSIYKHLHIKKTSAHKQVQHDQLVLRDETNHTAPPTNFLVGNQLFSKISIVKKLKDTIWRRRTAYHDSLLGRAPDKQKRSLADPSPTAF